MTGFIWHCGEVNEGARCAGKWCPIEAGREPAWGVLGRDQHGTGQDAAVEGGRIQA